MSKPLLVDRYSQAPPGFLPTFTDAMNQGDRRRAMREHESRCLSEGICPESGAMLHPIDTPLGAGGWCPHDGAVWHHDPRASATRWWAGVEWMRK